MNITPQDLRKVPTLADLAEPELQWLIEHGEVFVYAVGQVVVRSGDLPEWMYILLEGELVFYWASLGDAPYVTKTGGIVGALPHSRLAQYNGYGIAEQVILTLAIHRSQFPAMLQAIPSLEARLIGLMVDRVRDITRLDLRSEKLMSMGKLAAGLAHELNNPAAAAHRAAAQFKETLPALQHHTLNLIEAVGPQILPRLLEKVKTLRPALLSSLERSDLEESLGEWLAGRGVKAWDSLTILVEAGVEQDWLEQLEISPEALVHVIHWLGAYLLTQTLARDIETAAEHISGLVGAIKRYTYMDQTPRQEVDIHQGLEDTLALFSHAFKQGIRLERNYAPDLPRIEAFGSELNQVWTNLIDNALDAMQGSGTLRIRTAGEQGQILVEISDTGPGIPPEIKDKIFDPFFTTKDVGKGTGLGLDTVRRVVQHHKGSLRLESEPGNTRFQVRLPLKFSYPEP